MSLFNNLYSTVIKEAREKTVPSVAEDQPSYRRSNIEDPKAIKAAIDKLGLSKFKDLASNKDDIDGAVDIFNTINGLKEEDLQKTNLSKGELLTMLLNITKTPYHDHTELAENDIVRFKLVGRNALMADKKTSVEDKIKLNSQLPRWHNLYDNIYQEIYGKDSVEYRNKVKEYTKRDVSVAEEPKKIEKAELYYFDSDPSDPDSDAKPFRTTIIIPPNDYKTQEEKEANVPIQKAFWNEPRPNKAYGVALPPPWPFGVYTPKQLRGKTVEEIRKAVNSSDAELAHQILFPLNKYPEMYTMK
jgi:hypothetical protein